MAKPHFTGIYIVDYYEALASRTNDIANTKTVKCIFLSCELKAAYTSERIINPPLAKRVEDVFENIEEE